MTASGKGAHFLAALVLRFVLISCAFLISLCLTFLVAVVASPAHGSFGRPPHWKEEQAVQMRGTLLTTKTLSS